MIFKSSNLGETKLIAKKIAPMIKHGAVILLNGDLGAGKTTLTKFLCEIWGVDDVVSSPSFTIIKEYKAKDFKIYHIDLYRLNSDEELIEIGFDEVLNDPNSVKIIEWPNIAIDYFDKMKITEIKITFDENGNRIFEVENR